MATAVYSEDRMAMTESQSMQSTADEQRAVVPEHRHDDLVSRREFHLLLFFGALALTAIFGCFAFLFEGQKDVTRALGEIRTAMIEEHAAIRRTMIEEHAAIRREMAEEHAAIRQEMNRQFSKVHAEIAELNERVARIEAIALGQDFGVPSL